MTAVTVALGRRSFLTRSYNTGVSDVSRKLQEIIDGTVIDLRKSVTWNRVGNAIASLSEAFEECSEPNWDGYNAVPITAAAYEEAKAFLNALPPGIPVPEIVPEPDGGIGFEWDSGPSRTFAASVSGKGLIVYAGLLGKGTKAHGTETFDDAVPANIIEFVKRLHP